MTRPQPVQQAPPVQRLRIRYAKRGRLRFASHRDFSRAFERALVRSRLPMAYSSGFNPHPRISYAGAAPTGAASEAEYLEIGLAERVDAVTARSLLDQALPAGFDVLAVAESPGGALADRLQVSRWQLDLAGPPEPVDRAVAAFLDADEVPVTRMTKKGLRAFDARPAVLGLTMEKGEDAGPEPPARGWVRLHLLVRHQEPAVRPDDVLTGLVDLGGLIVEQPPRLIRWEQGPWDPDTGTIGDPLS